MIIPRRHRQKLSLAVLAAIASHRKSAQFAGAFTSPSQSTLVATSQTTALLAATLEDTSSDINGLSSPTSKTTSDAYSANQITVLSGLEPVRKRPGMYIGSTGPDGLHHLVYEVLDNSVDEALAGHASLINMVLHDCDDDDDCQDGAAKKRNCCTIEDDGRGIPTDLHPTTKISALETVLTVLHAGGKFDNAQQGSGYKVSGGLHGVGISVVNALSEFVTVNVDRKVGKNKSDPTERKMMRFERGVPVGGLQDVHFDNDASKNRWDGVIFQTKDSKGALSLGDDDDDDADDDDDDDSSSKGKGKSKAKPKKKAASKTKESVFDDETTTLEYKTNLVQTISSQRTSGTTVTFKPDITVFKGMNGKPDITFDAAKLALRFDEIAYLNAGLVLTMQDKRSSSKKKGVDRSNVVTIFHHAGGLAEYVELLCKGKTPMFGDGSAGSKTKRKVGKIKKDEDKEALGLSLSPDGSTLLFHAEVTPSSPDAPQTPITIDAALRYSENTYNEQILSFVNNIRTRDGGSHVEGLKSCLTRTLNQCARRAGKLKDGDANLGGDFVREGLTAIISVSVSEPEFEGQTKGRLGNPEVRPAVEAALGGELTILFDFHPDILNKLFENASQAQAAAAAAKAAREVVRKKSLLGSTVMPGKLSDCSSNTFSETELFIVEGDSAAGSAKQGRDRRTQAILPLKGKILNIERAAPARIYQNGELQGLISACGLGIKGAELEEAALRYGKIIIMTDADVDGAHIRVLLLTFFFRYQRELVEKGYVYIAQPPLYKVVTGSGKSRVEKYTFSEEEKDAYLREVLKIDGNKPITSDDLDGNVLIQRFKGLGEMMPKQLWETTMDPETRTLLKVSVKDCAMADQMLDILMGDSVAPRRNFISEAAESLKIGDLDV